MLNCVRDVLIPFAPLAPIVSVHFPKVPQPRRVLSCNLYEMRRSYHAKLLLHLGESWVSSAPHVGKIDQGRRVNLGLSCAGSADHQPSLASIHVMCTVGVNSQKGRCLAQPQGGTDIRCHLSQPFVRIYGKPANNWYGVISPSFSWL